jgi:hypothetical protein
MSLELHPKCKERLVEVIAGQLPSVVVKNRMFLDRKSAIDLVDAESVLPQAGGVREALNKYIGELPVFEFVCESLSKELHDFQEYSTEFPELKLTDIGPYADPVATASKLINDFDSLPWKYCLTIKFEEDLSKAVGRLIGNYFISNSFRIITPSDVFRKEFPVESGIKGRDLSLWGRMSFLSIPIPQEWKEGETYIQVETEGFVGQYGETATVERAIAEVKAFCGLAVALRLFKIGYKYRPPAEKTEFVVHQKVDNSWVIQRTLELDANIANTFNDLVLYDLDGKLDTDAKLLKWALSILGSIKTVFSTGKKAERIVLASQWLYDSYVGGNELLSFVLSTVVLEILLGDKAASDLVGLGELLRNRCAYLIGKSRQQREQILRDFQEIYDVCSKIVHRGHSRLSSRERMLLRNLQWMCRRVVLEEVNLLQKDLEGNT